MNRNQYIKRDIYLEKLIHRRDNGEVKIITGPRRCEKSWLLSHIYRDYLLEHNVKEENIVTVDFDKDEDKHVISMKKVLIIILMALFTVAKMPAQYRDPQRGYRGFVESESLISPDFGFLFPDGDGGGNTSFWTGVSTVHGYQFNPHLFVGAGMSCLWILNDSDHWLDEDSHKVKYLPLFADVRTDLRFGRFTPFADLRMGCNLLRDGTFSGALTIGYRFNWGRRVALNLALGVNLRGYREPDSDSGWSPEEGMWTRPNGRYRYCNDVRPAVRLGIEF